MFPPDPIPSVPGVTFSLLPGWPGYLVGDDGSVWSSKIRRRWQRLAGGTSGRGRRQTVLLSRDGTPHTRYVCHVVLEAFVGPRPAGMECCHGPGGPLDNRLCNLRWDTHAENVRDIHRQGGLKTHQGQRNVNARLTEAAVLLILRLRSVRLTIRQIAPRVGASEGAVSAVLRGESWHHVTGIPYKNPRKANPLAHS